MEGTHTVHGCCESGDGVHVAVASCCGFQRRFITKAERREGLEAYRTQLQNELTGVEERLAKLDE